MKHYYQQKADKLKIDIEHLKRHIQNETDPAEKARLVELKNHMTDERLNYLGAIE